MFAVSGNFEIAFIASCFNVSISMPPLGSGYLYILSFLHSLATGAKRGQVTFILDSAFTLISLSSFSLLLSFRPLHPAESLGAVPGF
jgi:hypothetical protein